MTLFLHPRFARTAPRPVLTSAQRPVLTPAQLVFVWGNRAIKARQVAPSFVHPRFARTA